VLGGLNCIIPGALVELLGDARDIITIVACGDSDDGRPADLWATAITSACGLIVPSPQSYVASMADVLWYG